MSRFLPAAVLSVLAAALLATPALAIHSGHIQGRIYDENGRPIAGALVTITGPEAIGIWTCRTDETGFYRIAGLDASRMLSVRVEAEGRATLFRNGYQVRDDETLHLDYRLKPVGVYQTLVIIDGRVPYFRTALAGARGTLPSGLKVMQVRNGFPRTVRKLRRVLGTRPDGVLAIGSLAARLARETLFDIPVVYTLVMDPVSEHLTRDNMCGVPSNGGFSEQLDVLSQMAPHAKRIGTIFDPANAAGVVRQLREEAEGGGFTLVSRPIHDVNRVSDEIRSLGDEHLDAFFLLLDPSIWSTDAFRFVRSWAQEQNVILIVPDGSMVRAGATFSYAPGFQELGAYAGRLLSQVMAREASVADIGVIYPTTRFFAVNPQDMDRFNLQMPPSVFGAAPGTDIEITLTPSK
ncbi:MAG TPA: ABC transporter substrate binding protein [Candidatus Saccharimonadales bacterium]|nr:ABC transporter substrate binding protein [Candidatus Saccharimonadales bacterium]